MIARKIVHEWGMGEKSPTLARLAQDLQLSGPGHKYGDKS
jgi:hypothetical protein